MALELFDPNVIHRLQKLDVPTWADKLLDEICDLTSLSKPAMVWYKMGRNHQAGGFYNHRTNELTVIAAGNPVQDELTIVHECAHAIMRADHTPEMYEMMILLVEHFGMDRRLAIEQEMEYQPEPFMSGLRRVIDYAKSRADHRG